MKNSIYLFFILFSCSEPMDFVVFKEQILEGTPCIGSKNYDVLNGIPFVNNNTYGNKPYGCLFVNKGNNYPVFDGEESARFEVKTNDCGGGEMWSDCVVDASGYTRSRSEIREEWTDPIQFFNKTISYTVNVFIPRQEKFKPAKDALVVLTQVHYNNDGVTGALCYLVMEENNTLVVRTHRDFTWVGLNDYKITDKPFDRWIKLKYNVKVSDKEDGYIEVYADDKFLFKEDRPTVQSVRAFIDLKFGIYNTFNKVRPPEWNQVIFFDGVTKSVK